MDDRADADEQRADPGADGTAARPVPADPRQAAVTLVVRELERHVADAGWDGPLRLFSLVRTAGALANDPALAGRLPPEVVAAARADAEHLTAVEQEDLPEADSLPDLLARIGWPPTVDGAAVVLERTVVPSDVERDLPQDEDEAARILADHPDRQDLRMAVAVLRDGTGACAVRSRANDDDALVAVGPRLVPALLDVLLATLRD